MGYGNWKMLRVTNVQGFLQKIVQYNIILLKSYKHINDIFTLSFIIIFWQKIGNKLRKKTVPT